MNKMSELSSPEDVALKEPHYHEKDQPGKTESAVWGQTKSFLAGGFGGVCAVLVGHPFDLVKVRLQTSQPGQYGGTLDVVKKTLAADGFRGLYRGVVAPLYGVTPMFAISFWGYDLGQRIVTSVTKPEGSLSIGQISAAGFLSAIPTTGVAAPFERVKVILQLQGQGKTQGKQFNGALDVVKHLYREGGLRSVFKGSVATLARDGPGSALYFATYEYTKRRLTPEGQTMSLGAITLAGGLAGTAMWIPVFPIDTIKSNLQSSDKPQSLSAVTKGIYRNGGFKAFFPGLGPALLRSFPANAATFVGVELAHSFFRSFNL
uniref:ARAD1D24816p n=1 Tax=Blastobotrys adeninivorans TaxID=409370 RepID=A0A060TGN7_BLAAD